MTDKQVAEISSTDRYTEALSKPPLKIKDVLAEQEKRDLKRQLEKILYVEGGTTAQHLVFFLLLIFV